jgi:hypothetical protein
MGIFLFPTNFVYWENVTNHDKIKTDLIDKIEKLDKTEYSTKYFNGLTNASTNFVLNNRNDIHEFMNVDTIQQLVWDPLENLLSKLPTIKLQNSVILASWYTKYNTNGTFNLHNHYGDYVIKNGNIYKPTFSMIYILNDENECNSTQFRVPLGSPLSTVLTKEMLYDTGSNKEIKEGTVIIFPSSLYHEVLPVKIPGRITIAFNIGSIFRDPTCP